MVALGRSPKILTRQQMLTADPGVYWLRGSNEPYYVGKQATGRRAPKSGNMQYSNYSVKLASPKPAPAPAPPPPAPKAAPKPKPKPAPKPTQNTQFSEAAAALLKSAEASLAAINKPAEKMKILQTGSIDVGAAPLQIGPAAPPPKTSGVDSFKRKKPASNPMKILTQNSLNI